jgi:hypothetical protein
VFSCYSTQDYWGFSDTFAAVKFRPSSNVAGLLKIGFLNIEGFISKLGSSDF